MITDKKITVKVFIFYPRFLVLIKMVPEIFPNFKIDNKKGY